MISGCVLHAVKAYMLCPLVLEILDSSLVFFDTVYTTFCCALGKGVENYRQLSVLITIVLLW